MSRLQIISFMLINLEALGIDKTNAFILASIIMISGCAILIIYLVVHNTIRKRKLAMADKMKRDRIKQFTNQNQQLYKEDEEREVASTRIRKIITETSAPSSISSNARGETKNSARDEPVIIKQEENIPRTPVKETVIVASSTEKAPDYSEGDIAEQVRRRVLELEEQHRLEKKKQEEKELEKNAPPVSAYDKKKEEVPYDIDKIKEVQDKLYNKPKEEEPDDKEEEKKKLQEELYAKKMQLEQMKRKLEEQKAESEKKETLEKEKQEEELKRKLLEKEALEKAKVEALKKAEEDKERIRIKEENEKKEAIMREEAAIKLESETIKKPDVNPISKIENLFSGIHDEDDNSSNSEVLRKEDESINDDKKDALKKEGNKDLSDLLTDIDKKEKKESEDSLKKEDEKAFEFDENSIKKSVVGLKNAELVKGVVNNISKETINEADRESVIKSVIDDKKIASEISTKLDEIKEKEKELEKQKDEKKEIVVLERVKRDEDAMEEDMIPENDEETNIKKEDEKTRDSKEQGPLGKEYTELKTRSILEKINLIEELEDRDRKEKYNNVINTLADDYRKIILVMSTENAGKTTVAVNLAYELANRGIKTILIDTDNKKKDVYYYTPKEYMGCLSRLSEFDKKQDLYKLGIKINEALTVFSENKGIEFELAFDKLVKLITYAHELNEAVIIDVSSDMKPEYVRELLLLTQSILLILDKRTTTMNRLAEKLAIYKEILSNKRLDVVINMDEGQKGINKSTIRNLLKKMEYIDEDGAKKMYTLQIHDIFSVAYDTKSIILALDSRLPAIMAKENKIIGDIKKIASHYYNN